jgi:hypothetical protein
MYTISEEKSKEKTSHQDSHCKLLEEGGSFKIDITFTTIEMGSHGGKIKDAKEEANPASAHFPAPSLTKVVSGDFDIKL